jgi:RNA-splicing ligase RtcB
VVEEVIDPEACRVMGLEAGRAVAMFHTGSERLGHDLGRLWSWRRKTDPRRRRRLFWRKVALHFTRDVRGPGDLRRRWAHHFGRRGHVAVPADSRDGRRLGLSLGIAANYGYANRAAVAGLIQQAFRRWSGSRGLALEVVADLSHNTIQRERIDGEDLWIHRHNAARSAGPSHLDADHPYRAIGQPVMIPGTNRTSSYVVVGRDGSAGSLHSVDHGAGRTVERFAAAGLLRERSGRTTRKYGYDSPGPEILPHLTDEGIEDVIAVVERAGIASPAARLRPVAVLKA